MKRIHYLILLVIIVPLVLLGWRFNPPAATDAIAGPDRIEQWLPQTDESALATTFGPNSHWDLVANGAEFIAIKALSAGEAWGLTHDDRFYHYSGSTWDLGSGPDDAVILDMDFAASDAGWAVGYRPTQPVNGDGAIWRYNGSGWQQESIPSVRQLHHVDMLSSSSGWAVGADVMLRFDGQWQIVATANMPDLVDISTAADGTLWGTAPDGIYYFDGLNWQLAAANTQLTAIALSKSDSSGWAVGEQGRIWHYDGVTWSDATPGVTTAGLNQVAIITATDVWAVGNDGVILYYNGNGWAQVASNTDEALQSISMSGSGSGWISGRDSTLLQYNGSSWLEQRSLIQPPALTSDNLYGLSVLSSNDIWVVGGLSPQSNIILHYNGSDWGRITSPITRPLYAVDMLSSTDGWAVGGDPDDDTSVILHYDGGSWQPVASPVNQPLYAVDMINGAAGWAVGGDRVGHTGVMVRYDNNVWQSVSLPNNTPALLDIAMISSDDGWAVGEEGTILRLVGGVWQTQSLGLPGEHLLAAIQMVSPTDGWIVGNTVAPDGRSDTGLILHFDGNTWQPVQPATGSIQGVTLRDVQVAPDYSLGWIVGDSGVSLYYRDGFWFAYRSQPDENYFAVSVTDNETGWIVGSGGAVLTASGLAGGKSYFPIVAYNYPPLPTPTPTVTPTPLPTVLYNHDFDSSHQSWAAWTSSGPVGGDCRSFYDQGDYILEAPTNSNYPCFRWAPNSANYRYAAVETRGFFDEGSSDAEYGLYLNGDGGTEYYLLKIRTNNDCGWEFIRRHDDQDSVKRRGDCTFINQNHDLNTLRIKHERNDNEDILTFYINGTDVGQYSESHSSALSGDGTGLYMAARSNDYALINYLYYTVFSVP